VYKRQGVVDELLLYLAPMLLGQGAGLAALGPFARLDDALRLRWHTIDRIGDDVRLLLRLSFSAPEVLPCSPD